MSATSRAKTKPKSGQKNEVVLIVAKTNLQPTKCQRTCVDVGRGAQRSVPARWCKAHTAVDRAPTLAARRTLHAALVTGDRSTRLLLYSGLGHAPQMSLSPRGSKPHVMYGLYMVPWARA